MDEKLRNDIIRIFEERGVNLPCPRCRREEFTILDGLFIDCIQPDPSAGMVIGGSTVPSVITICNNCGFMSQHALGALGLMKKEKVKGE